MEYISYRKKIFELLFSGKVGFLLLIVLCIFFLLLPGGPFMSFESDWVAVRAINAAALPHAKIQSAIFTPALYFITELFGDEEFCFRLLNIPVAVLTLIGTALLGRKYGGHNCAVNAAWLLLGSFGFLFWGRLASDAMMVCALGVWGAVLLMPGQESYGRRGFFRIFVSVVVLLSGILLGDTVTFIVLPLFLLIHKFMRHQKFRFSLMATAAVISAAVLTALLIILITSRVYKVNFFSIEAIKLAREFTEVSLTTVWRNFPQAFGSGSWYYGLMIICEMFLPWLLFFAAAVVMMLKQWKSSPVHEKALLILIAMIIIILCIAPGRELADYLVVLPFLAVFTAGSFGKSRQQILFFWSDTAMRYSAIVGASLTAALPVTLPLWEILLKIEPPVALMILTPLMGLVVLLVMTFIPQKSNYIDRLLGMQLPVSTILIAWTLLAAVVICVFLPVAQSYRTDRRFWRYSGRILKHDGNTALLVFGAVPNAAMDYYFATEQKIFVVSAKTDIEKIFEQYKLKKAAFIAPFDEVTRVEFNDYLVSGFNKPHLLEPAMKDNFFTSIGTVPNQRLGLWQIEVPLKRETEK